MHKILALLFLTLTFLFSSQMGVVHSLDPNGDGFLSLRSKPKGREIGKLYNDNKVKILKRVGKYYKVKVTNSGMIGYAHSNWIRKTSNTATASNSSSSKSGVVTGLDPNGNGFLSLRSKPKGREIGKLYNGDKLSILESRGKWVKVKTASAGQIGWAHGDWVETLLSKQPTLNQCDKLAGDPNDILLGSKGIPFGRIDANMTIKSCKNAIEEDKSQIRYIYQLGRGYEKNKKFLMALKYYQIAADKGYPIALFSLAELYSNTSVIGEGKIKKNKDKAFKYYTLASNQGLPIANHKFGFIYYFGYDGIAKNLKLSTNYYKKAADKGYAPSQYQLATAYKEGIGIDKNYKKYVYYLKKSAQGGDERAEYELAIIYLNGDGVNQNKTIAMKYLKKSAAKGYYKALYNLGIIYKEGTFGEKKNYKKAKKLFQELYDNDFFGSIQASYELGTMYRDGLGVKKDCKEAMVWFGIGVLKDYKDSENALKNLNCKQ